MDVFQWEQPQAGTPFWIHMIAGSCAGLSEHLSMLPLDNVKTHCQAGYRKKIVDIVKNIYNHGGIYNFYSGSSVVAMGCVPAHAIYFLIYEKTKQILDPQVGAGSLMFGVVGVASSLFHDLIMTPTQAIKQRLQLTRSLRNQNISVLQLIKSTYRSQGLFAFYRSFGINYLMNVPFGSFIIMANENLKHLFGVKQQGHHLSYYLCGGLAGGIASIPTTPFDVIKTKLNVQSCVSNLCQKKNSVCSVLNNEKMHFEQTSHKSIPTMQFARSISTNKDYIKYHTIIDTTRTIFLQQGLKGFFTGLKMRIMIQSASSAIAWGTYQSLKSIMQSAKRKYQ